MGGQLIPDRARRLHFDAEVLSHRRVLPFKPAHAALVRQLIVLEQQHGYTLRGKTGLGEQDGHAVSWLVGDVDVKGEPYVYAALLVDPSEDTGHLLPLRRSLPEKFLSRFGLAAPKSP